MLKTKQEQQKFCREFNISADIFLSLPEASCTKKRVSEVTKSLIKLRVKIPADIIRRQKKPTENLHIHTLRPFHIPLCQRLLKIFQKITPFLRWRLLMLNQPILMYIYTISVCIISYLLIQNRAFFRSKKEQVLLACSINLKSLVQVHYCIVSHIMKSCF